MPGIIHLERFARTRAASDFLRSPRVGALVDQGCQGAANVLMSAVLARHLGRVDFASVGFILGMYYWVAGLFRANVILPFIVSVTGHPDEESRLGDWWRLAVIVSGLTALALAGGGLVFRLIGLAGPVSTSPTWMANAVLLCAPVSGTLLLAEFGRRALYQINKPFRAAACSVVYAGVGVGSTVLAVARMPTAAACMVGWTAAGAAALAAALLALPPPAGRWMDGVRIWRAQRNFALWQSACHIPYAIYNASVILIVGAFAGPIAASTFVATRTLANPALSLVTAVDSTDKPRASRSFAAEGVSGLGKSIRRTRFTLTVGAGIYLGLVVAFAPQLLRLVSGTKYLGATNDVRVLCLAFFLTCLNQPSETYLIVLRASSLLFSVRVATATLAVLLIWCVGGRAGGMGSAIALSAVQAFNLVALGVAERAAGRGWKRRHKADEIPVQTT